MLKLFLTALIVGVVLFLGFQLRDYASRTMKASKAEATPKYAPGKLPGLPAELESSLEEAKRQGTDGLRDWFRQHRPETGEPRLTEIELDYVVLTGPSNPGEARRVLNSIKSRLTPDSPLYKRFQQLDQTYP